MTQRDNILQELNDLNSQLAGQNPLNVYEVPSGYFENLVAEVMKRIKALEANNAADELAHLSPLLNTISKQNPYTVPAGYFDELGGQLTGIMQSADHLSAEEETASISPLLAGLKKENPYQVPAGYFENLSTDIAAKESKPQANVVSFTSRKWFRYAAAAVVTGVVVLAGFLYFTTKNNVSPVEQPYAWVKKSFKKADPKEIEAFVALADEELPNKNDVASNPVNTAEIKELLQDVSEQEIQSFLSETSASEETDSETVIN